MSWALVVTGSHCCSCSALYIWKNNIVRDAILIQYQLWYETVMKQLFSVKFGELPIIWRWRKTNPLPTLLEIHHPQEYFFESPFRSLFKFYHFYSYIRTKQKTKEIIITAMIFFLKNIDCTNVMITPPIAGKRFVSPPFGSPPYVQRQLGKILIFVQKK